MIDLAEKSALSSWCTTTITKSYCKRLISISTINKSSKLICSYYIDGATIFYLATPTKSTLERVSNAVYCCINGVFRELRHKSAMNIT